MEDAVSEFVSKQQWLLDYLPDSSMYPAIAISLTLYIFAKFNFTDDSGDIKCAIPVAPLLMLKTTISQIISYYYGKFKKEKIFSILYFNRILIVIKDWDIVAKMRKDRECLDEEKSSEGEHPLSTSWKLLRVSDVESNKLRIGKEEILASAGAAEEDVNYPLINECVKELLIQLEAKANRKCTIDLREYCLRYAQNVIGVYILGRTVTTLTNANCEFYQKCDALFDNPTQETLAGNIVRRLFGANNNVESKRVLSKYFIDMARTYRDDQRALSEDGECLLKKLLKTAGSQSIEELDKEDYEYVMSLLIGVSIYMSDVMSGIMCLTLYEISKNQQIQEKLRPTLQSVTDSENTPCLSSDKLQQLTYLDDIVKEVIRKYPTVSQLSMLCVKAYNLPETKLQINPGVTVVIPVTLMQRDSEQFEEADSFNPDRFHQQKSFAKAYDTHATTIKSSVESFDNFVHELARVFVKSAIACLVQQYEFQSAGKISEKSLSTCRLSGLSRTSVPLRITGVKNKHWNVPWTTFQPQENKKFLSKIGL